MQEKLPMILKKNSNYYLFKNEAKKIEIEQLIKKRILKTTPTRVYVSKEKGAEILIDEIGENFIEF